MRDVGHEIAPHRFELAHARQVLHQQQAAAGMPVRHHNELQESEEKFKQLVEDMNDGYFVVQDTRIVFANARSAEMFGYSTVLRSLTRGQAQFTMEFLAYRQVPQSVAEELEKKAAEQKKKVA